jgi:hypothetical protein
MLALVLFLTAGKAMAAAQVTAADAAKCPLRGADLDKLTTYRWKVAQYKADQVFIPSVTIRVDTCQLIGWDDKGRMKTGLLVNIARGAHADALAKYWRAVCAESLVQEARGTVQPVPGVTGGYRCVTAKGTSTLYWLESAGQTVQMEPADEPETWSALFAPLLAAAAR